MRAIAHNAHRAFLLIQDKDYSGKELDFLVDGRVLNLDGGYVSGPNNVYSIIRVGTWEPIDLSDAQVRAMLPGLKILGPGIDEDWDQPITIENRKWLAEQQAKETNESP